MPLRDVLTRILSDYQIAKSQPLEGHPLAQFIRGDAATAVYPWRCRNCRDGWARRASNRDGRAGEPGAGQLGRGPMGFGI